MAISATNVSSINNYPVPTALPKVQFGVNGSQVKAVAKEAKIKNLSLASWTFNVADKLKLPWQSKSLLSNNIHIFNLSLEDWASRIAILFGLYVPQTVQAFKEDKHKWETLGRNVLSWTLTAVLTVAIKADALPITSGMTQFIRQKIKDNDFALGNKIRPEYQTFIKKYGKDLIKAERLANNESKLSEKWSKLSSRLSQLEKASKQFDVEDLPDQGKDFNVTKEFKELTKELNSILDSAASSKTSFSFKAIFKHIVRPFKQLQDTIKSPFLESVHKAINPLRVSNSVSLKKIFEKADIALDPKKWDSLDGTLHNKLKFYLETIESKITNNTASALEKKTPSIIKNYIFRRGVFQALKTTLIALTMIYIIGGLVMDLTYHTFARLDHDFDAEAYEAKKAARIKNKGLHIPSLDLAKLENQLRRGVPPKAIKLVSNLKESVWRQPQKPLEQSTSMVPVLFSQFQPNTPKLRSISDAK